MASAFSNSLIAFLADRAAFCYALQSILQNVGGFSGVRLPGDQTALADEVCMVDFKRVSATGDRAFRIGLGDGKRQEYNIFTGRAEVVYGIARALNAESTLVGCIRKLDEKEGIIRACFLRSQHYFTVGRLPNFAVGDIIEDQPPSYGVDKTGDRERDVLMLSFLVTYERVMANFPAS